MSLTRAPLFPRLFQTADDRAALRVLLPLVGGVSLAMMLGFALQSALRRAAEADHLEVLLRGWDGLAWIVWPVVAPAILLAIRRFPLVRGHLRRGALRLGAASACLCFAIANVQLLIRLIPNVWLPPAEHLPISLKTHFVSVMLTLPLDILVYGGFLAVSLAIDYSAKNRRRSEELQLKLRTAQLESQLAQAELEMLRGQLHPHFLFNSFNAVAALVRLKRNDAAVEMIAQLSGLLRQAIERTGRHELPLQDELDFVQRYLEIERIRFGDKLDLQLDFTAAELDTLVPNLLLQPLVENAIKHGISRRTIPGTVRVSARRRDDRVVMEIENDGPDQPAPPSGRKGIGLLNTRARLDRIYGSGYRLDLSPRPDGGMLVRIELPLRPLKTKTTAP